MLSAERLTHGHIYCDESTLKEEGGKDEEEGQRHARVAYDREETRACHQFLCCFYFEYFRLHSTFTTFRASIFQTGMILIP